MNIDFQLDGLIFPDVAKKDFNQTYEPLGGRTVHRMGDGTAALQQSFSKIKTVLTGQGWTPGGLDNLDYTQAMLLKCAAPRIQTSTSNIMTIPADRRSDGDFVPIGFAVVDGVQVETTIGIVVDLATLGVVSGASSYQVQYYPEITVYAEFDESSDLSNANYNWTLTCEEQ